MMQKVCPSCGHGDELIVIEDVRIERKLGDVTDSHIEYCDVVPNSESSYREVGVQCNRCMWNAGGADWRKHLKGVKIDD